MAEVPPAGPAPQQRLSVPFAHWWTAQRPVRGAEPMVDADTDTRDTRTAIATPSSGALRVGAVVIGSGYGGSVAALRLAERGHQVLLLERGSEYLPGEFANDVSLLPKAFRLPSIDGRKVLGRANGLIEGRAGPGLLAVVANGVGGGSLINAGVVLEPEDEVFALAAWPLAIRKATDGAVHGLKSFFDKARGELGVHDFTPRYAKTEALQRWAGTLPPGQADEAQWLKSLPLTIDPAHCVGCGDCASGCNVVGAKRTLRDTYLSKAVATGRVTVLSSASVYALRPSPAGASPAGTALAGTRPAGVQRWHLRVLPTPRITAHADWADLAADASEGAELDAELVVVAAGTFGSTELLQRSQALAGAGFWLSPALGTRLSGNGDGIAVSAREPQAVHAVGWGADTWQAPAGPDAPAGSRTATRSKLRRVGPTITAMVDLRRTDVDPKRRVSASGGPGSVDLERRVVVQDAAVPGAVGRVFAELLASLWALDQLGGFRTRPTQAAGSQFQPTQAAGSQFWPTQAAGSQFRPTQAAGFDADPLAAGDLLGDNAPSTLAQRSQVLLMMGHDGSRGRIVWQAGRDASVPYWEGVADLATYQVQARWLDSLRQVHGTPLANPLMQLPAALAALAAGESLMQKTITTVHPLGGCPMGDEPALAVVDDLGRVYADLHDASRRWPGLYVLDGSVVPSSLGINPLLTITALAERAALKFPSPLGHTATQLALPLAHPQAATPPRPARLDPKPFERPARPVLEAALFERLAGQLRLHGELALALKADAPNGLVDAEMELTLHSPDWLALWDDPRHRLSKFNGSVRLQAGARLLSYKVLEGSHADLLAVGAAPRLGQPGRAFWELLNAVGNLGPLRWLRALGTWLVLRWRDVCVGLRRQRGVPEHSALRWVDATARLLRGAVAMAKQITHAAQPRHMRYRLHLELTEELVHDPVSDRLLASTNDAGAGTAVPAALCLEGVKRVEYAASVEEGWRWFAAWLRRCLGSDKPMPRLRESFVEQSSHLQISLNADGKSQAHGRLLMDVQSILGGVPIRLGARGDSTSGGIGLAAYLGVFGRVVATTRLLDFRVPEYSGTPLPDAADAASMVLLCSDGKRVVPDEIKLRVPRGASSSAGADEDPKARVELKLWRYRRPASKPEPAVARDGAPHAAPDSAPDKPQGLPEVLPGSWLGLPVRRARSVLLLHAFGQSGYTFTAQSLGSQAMAPVLYDAGWEVWILDHRISTRLPEGQRPSTMDQIARHDLPGAVDEILAMLDAELDTPTEARPPLQIFAFGQCIGSATLAMSMLSGRLSHGLPAPQPAAPAGVIPRLAGQVPRPPTPVGVLPQLDSQVPQPPSPVGVLPQLSKLAGVLLAQTHPHCIGAPIAQAKTWVPSLIRDALRRAMVPFAVRGPVTSPLERLMDGIFSMLPVPHDEACPDRRWGAPEDDCATCRRIRFIEAPLFKHRNLLRATHLELPRLFGDANVRLFAHVAKCINAERLVDEDARYVYVNDENIARHFALPIGFVHGTENELFEVESATRSAEQVARVHPVFAQLMRDALAAQAGAVSGAQHASSPGAGHGADLGADLGAGLGAGLGTFLGASPGATLLIPGHGHLDALIGRHSSRLLHRPVALAFDHLMGQPAHGKAADADPPATMLASIRLPGTGPMVGRLQRVGQQIELRVSFRIDDRFSDGKRDARRAASERGTRTWAFARLALNGHWLSTVRLRITTLPAPQADLYRVQTASGKRLGERFASGSLRLTFDQARQALDTPSPHPIGVECLSVHEAICHGPMPADLQPLHPALDQGTGDPPDAWLDAGLQQRLNRLERFALDNWPRRLTRSYLRLKPEQAGWRTAQLDRAAWAAVLPNIEADAAAQAQVSFVAGSCRYPGFRFEIGRVDDWQALIGELAGSNPGFGATQFEPAFGLLLGDQIYADATAGFTDELSPTERFNHRHGQAFGRRLGSRPGKLRPKRLGDWLGSLPVTMIADDHEYIDSYPNGPPLVMAPRSLGGPRRGRKYPAERAAWWAMRGFQRLQGASFTRAWQYFETGPLRLLALDTRSQRRTQSAPAPAESILNPAMRHQLTQWVSDPAALQRLNVIATGSVVLPGLRDDADPTTAGERDTFQRCPADRAWLLELLATRARDDAGFRFLLLSGDYHVSAFAALAVDGGACIGAALVAPPLFAPMPYLDALPHAVWMDEAIALGGGGTLRVSAVDGVSAQRGSGACVVDVQRLPGSSPIAPQYRITVRRKLRELASYGDAVALTALTLDL